MLGDQDKIFEIQTEQFSVELKNRYEKILRLMPASRNTFVFLATIGIGSDALVHVDASGKVLFEYKFKRQVDSMTMVGQNEVLVLEPRLDQLTCFNLTGYLFTVIPFNFMNEEFDQSTILTFAETKSFCIVENGKYNDNRFRLSYFQGPFDEKLRPFHIYESDQEWNYQYLVRKGNESSLILWFKARHDQQVQLKCYKITDKNMGEFKCYKTKNQVGVPYNYNGQVQLALENAWQVKPGVFCLIANSEKTNLSLKNSNNSVNNNFYWNIQSNELREAAFWFDEKYSDNLIDIHLCGQFSIFRTYFFQNGVVESSPVYYVHNSSEKVVASDRWVCSYLVKFQYPLGGEIVESEYQNAGVERFKMKIKRIVEKKQ